MISAFKDYIIVFFCAMAPVTELRAALPMGAAMGLELMPLLLTCIVGNMVPSPFIILCIRRILRWMRNRGGILGKAERFIDNKGKKASEMLYKYELLGLFLLVAIPLPGTGAWTGSLVAAMFGIRLKVAIPVIAAGVTVAGVIVSFITYGAVSVFGL